MSARRRYAIFLTAAALSVAGIVYASVTNDLLAKFSQLEQQYNLPGGILSKIAKVESGGNASASTGNAVGMFQFMPATWLRVTSALYGSARPLAARTDPYLSAEATAFMLAQTRSQLGGQIQAVTSDMTTGLYLGHLLGAAGASKFLWYLKNSPNTIVASVFARETPGNAPFLGRGQNFIQSFNTIAARLGSGGITNVSGYNGSAIDPNSARIMDAAGLSYLSQTYNGPVPTTDPNYTYQTDWNTPLSQSQQLPTLSTQSAQTSNASYQTGVISQLPDSLQSLLSSATGSIQLSDFFSTTTYSNDSSSSAPQPYYNFSALLNSNTPEGAASGSPVVVDATAAQATSLQGSEYRLNDSSVRIAAFGPEGTFPTAFDDSAPPASDTSNMNALQSILVSLKSMLQSWLAQLQG